MNNDIELKKLVKRSNDLFNRTKDILDDIGADISEFPTSVYENQKPISIVFAGQYSAGKSTILKALTGIDSIEIGCGITTQKANTYDLNGLSVIDTPGIHTTLRPDHDEISYKAITESDMLVYVVTQELFDSFVGQNFRKLLIENNKADEMILVVNKMADVGNTKTNQKIKSTELEKVTSPYSTYDLRVCFIDAESYLDSLNEEDEDVLKELYERSNFEQLISTINKFVKEKEIPSKLTTSLYKISDIVNTSINNLKSSTEDDITDAIKEEYYQEYNILYSYQLKLKEQIKIIYEEAGSKIRDKGREIANEINSYTSEEDASNAIEQAFSEVDSISSKCKTDIINKIEDITSKRNFQLIEFYNSEFVKELDIRINLKQNKMTSSIVKMLESGILSEIGSVIVKNTVVSGKQVNGLQLNSGSNVHNFIKYIGDFFGHKFKPWEAVKWTKGINVSGKIIGGLGIVLQLVIQAKEDIDNNKLEKQMRSNRESLRSSFNEAAKELTNHYSSLLNTFIEENYTKQILKLESNITLIDDMRNDKSEKYALLVKLRSECFDLISDIHSAKL